MTSAFASPSSTPINPVNSIDPPDYPDLAETAQLIWRHKRFVFICTLAGFIIAMTAAIMQPPLYKAQALITLDSQNSSPLMALGLGRIGGTNAASDIEILRARPLAQDVITRLGLQNNAALNQAKSSALPPVGLPPLIQKNTFKSFRLNEQDTAAPQPPSAEALQMEASITAFLKNLSVKQQPGGTVIRIEYTAHSPAQAAQIVNTLIEVYIDHRAHAQEKSAALLKAWIDNKIGTLNADEEKAKQALITLYKEQNALLPEAQKAQSAELASLNASLISAQETLTALSAANKAASAGQYEAIPDIQNSPVIEKLRLSKADLERSLADLQTRYGQKHPRIIQVHSELEALNARIADESAQIAALITQRYQQAQTTLNTLKARQKNHASAILGSIDSQFKAADLERTLEGYQQLYLQTLQRKNEMELSALQTQNVQIISSAVPPYHPASPNLKLLAILGGFIGLIFALITLIIRDKMDSSIRSITHLEHLTQTHCYGLVPQIKESPPIPLSEMAIKHPKSSLAEAIRTLRVAIDLSAGTLARSPAHSDQQKGTLVTLTSSFPGEGKTLLSTWLARSAAQSGQRVILVDCDLRRPNVHRTLGHQNETSIVEYLTGQDDNLAALIQKDTLSKLHIIYARAVPGRALDLLYSKRMHTLLQALQQSYDLIILDTPACMGITDARVLASLSDLTLYIADWMNTPVSAVRSGLRQFKETSKKLGCVLSNVDLKRHARYGYGRMVDYYDDTL